MISIDPVVWFFLVGLAAGLLRSDLRLPAALYESLSIFLLLAIGLKGGVELAKQPFGSLLPQMLAVVLMGVVLPLMATLYCVTPGASNVWTRRLSPPITARSA